MARQLSVTYRRRFSCKHPGYTLKDVTFWAQLTGDTNPIHTDSKIAKAAGEAERSHSAMSSFCKDRGCAASCREWPHSSSELLVWEGLCVPGLTICCAAHLDSPGAVACVQLAL